MSCFDKRSKLFTLLYRLKALVLLLILVTAGLGVPTSPSVAATQRGNEYIDLPVPQAPGGNVITLAMAPTDPNVLYNLIEGTNGYRLFRSLDGGLNWQERHIFPYFAARYTRLAVDQANPDIVYAFGDTNFQLLRSVDGGETWTPFEFGAEVFAAASSQRLYAGSGAGSCNGSPAKNYSFSRSDDGGQTWQSTLIGCLYQIQNIAVLSSQPDLVYLLVYKAGTGAKRLLKSPDAGLTWNEIVLMFETVGGDLLIDPQNPERMYISSYDGVFRSLDGGNNWEQILPQIIWAPHHIALSGGTLYAMPEANYRLPIFRTNDGGATWWASYYLLPAGSAVLLTDPIRPERIWAGLVNYGIYFSEDNGGSWSEVNSGILSQTTINSLSVPASDSNIVYAAVQWPYAGVYRSDDGGQTWGPRMLGFDSPTSNISPAFRFLGVRSLIEDSFSSFPLAIHKVLAHPQNPDIAWAATSNGIYETVNGLNWQLKISGKDAVDLAVSPVDPDHPFAVLHTDQYQTFYARRHCNALSCYWYEYGKVYVNTLVSLDAIAMDTQLPGRLLAAGVMYTSTGKAVGIYQHLDSEYTWRLLGQINLDAVPAGLVVAPQNTRFMIVLLKSDISRLFCSQDGGATWDYCPPEYARPMKPPMIDELSIAYVGTIEGVYRRLPTQTIWEPFWLNGLLVRIIYAITYCPGPAPKLLAATEHVLWRLNLPPIQLTWMPVVAKALQ